MLSTAYRVKLEEICNRITKHQEVSLTEIIWAEKLAKANRSASTMLRQARRTAENPDMPKGGLDEFLNALDIGETGSESKGISGFNSVDEIVDWFKQDKNDDWRQRD